jgi:hypothetical protein
MTKYCSQTPNAGRWVTLAALATMLAGCVAPIATEEPADTGYDESGTDVAVLEAPPSLPDDDQPPCPQDGYIWVPGYWAYQSGDLGGGDYYWVPGAWVQPPEIGVLWTPGYWSYADGGFSFHAGYWGPHVGFYGGIGYGHGYPGDGYIGGAWQGNQYSYNRAVTNVDAALVRSTYNTTFNSNPAGKASYNGVGGIIAGPSAREREFAAEPHVAATPAQQARAQQAARNPALITHVAAKSGASIGSTHAVSQAPVTRPKTPAAPKPTSGDTSTDKGGFSP